MTLKNALNPYQNKLIESMKENRWRLIQFTNDSYFKFEHEKNLIDYRTGFKLIDSGLLECVHTGRYRKVWICID